MVSKQALVCIVSSARAVSGIVHARPDHPTQQPGVTAAESLELCTRRPGIIDRLRASAESATHWGVASIPHITFVILDAVFAQKLAVFFPKGAPAMVLLLERHVFEGASRCSRVLHPLLSVCQTGESVKRDAW